MRVLLLLVLSLLVITPAQAEGNCASDSAPLHLISCESPEVVAERVGRQCQDGTLAMHRATLEQREALTSHDPHSTYTGVIWLTCDSIPYVYLIGYDGQCVVQKGKMHIEIFERIIGDAREAA